MGYMMTTIGLTARIFGAGLLIGTLAPIASADDGDKAIDLPVEQVEKIVRDYLMREPEIIYQALEEMQKRQAAEQADKAKEMLVTRKDDLLNDPATPIAGNPDGEVTLVEFFDYRCGYCRRVLSSMQALMEEDTNLRIAFKELPVLGEDSTRAARAALASQQQDKGLYLDFHLALMSAKDLSSAGISKLAQQTGLDPAKLAVDMESDEVSKAIEANYELASALGIEGTPAFVIGDTLVPGAVDKARLVELIEKTRTAIN